MIEKRGSKWVVTSKAGRVRELMCPKCKAMSRVYPDCPPSIARPVCVFCGGGMVEVSS